MHYQITPSMLSGIGSVSSSKSHSLRAILFASMAEGSSVIHNLLASPDAEAMIAACVAIGAGIRQEGNTLYIDGTGGKLCPPANVIDVGNSGQALRFVGAMAALIPNYTVLTGDHSICTLRPMAPLLDGLSQLGVFAVSSKGDGRAPVIIKGPVSSTERAITMDGSDSQPVSALLMLAAFLEGTTTITVIHPGETPWIGLTLDWLTRLGVNYTNEDFHRYTVIGGSALTDSRAIVGFNYTVPADWSSAAFPIAAALVTNSEITLEHIDFADSQGDKEILLALEKMGAQFTKDSATGRLQVHSHDGLYGAKLDVNAIIDSVPVLAAIACYATTPTTLVGAAIARQKESDRLSAIAQELRKMGARIDELPDGLIIYPSALHGAQMQSHHDHRIAMATAIAALGAKGMSTISNTDCVAKSFPGFAKTMNSWQAAIQEIVF